MEKKNWFCQDCGWFPHKDDGWTGEMPLSWVNHPCKPKTGISALHEFQERCEHEFEVTNPGDMPVIKRCKKCRALG